MCPNEYTNVNMYQCKQTGKPGTNIALIIQCFINLKNVTYSISIIQTIWKQINLGI